MEKNCRWCGQTKPLSDFYKHSRTADGYLGKCKECQKKNSIAARNRNIDRYRAHDRSRSNLPHRVLAREEYAKTDAYKESHKKANDRWGKAHPNRRAASHILGNAVRDGKVVKLPCFICGEKAQAHHPDYDRPLDVVWLCPKHHKEAHALVKTYNDA